MDSTGFIEGIGTISSVVKPPAIGLAVEKSGRTTGTTTGTIASINTSVNVQYKIRWGQGRKYTISYTNQVVINSNSFSAGGDSGSLIATSNTCHQPVALLFAGSSTTTIGNPIGEVVTKLGAALGTSVSFVGGNCTGSPLQDFGARSFQLPQQALDHAGRVLEQNRHDLISRPGVLGVGLGALEDNSAPAILVCVDKTSPSTPQLPAQIDNVPVRVIMTNPFIAFWFQGLYRTVRHFCGEAVVITCITFVKPGRSQISFVGRTIWIADAHRGDGKRFVVRAEEKLTAFLELESAIRRRLPF
jgi:hypothetical protein